jgi:type II secretory pathway pseudopilin PulG
MNTENIIIILGTTLAVVLFSLIIVSVKALKLRKKLKTLLVAYSKIELFIASQKEKESDNDVHKENFIKFLSDSRDWAYEYIETVQSGLNKFVSDVDADISYFDEYGDALSMSRPDYKSMKNISNSYKELKKLLPVEEKQ